MHPDADDGGVGGREEDDERAAEIRHEMLLRSQAMPDALRRELFAQYRLFGKGYDEVPPALFVDAAEGRTIFRGLNHSRPLLGPVRDVVAKIAKQRDAVRAQFEAMLPHPTPREQPADAAEPSGGGDAQDDDASA